MKSISEVFSSLRSSFREADYKDAEKELKSREDLLRKNYDALESERSELKLQVLQLEEERRRLRRECEISNDKVVDLARELSLSKERESKGIKRYESLLDDVRVMEGEKDEVLSRLEESRVSLGVLREELEVLRRNVGEKEEEIRVLERIKEGELGKLKEENEALDDMVRELMRSVREMEGENEGLRMKVTKLEVRKENEERIQGLMRENECLAREKAELEDRGKEMRRGMREMEAEIERLGMRVRDLETKNEEFDVRAKELRGSEERIKGLLKENERLAAAKAESDDLVESMKRITGEMELSFRDIVEKLDKEKLERGIGIEREEKIEELMRKVECLEKEKMEAIRRYEGVEQIVMKLEEDVAKWLLVNLPKDKSLTSAWIGKVLSEVIKALDSEDGGVSCEAGTNQAGYFQGVASPINECCLKTGETYDAAGRTSLDSKIEVSSEIEASGTKKDTSSTFIILSDSDNENDNPIHAKELKKERVSSRFPDKSSNYDDFSYENLNSTQKLKKLKTLLHEEPKHKHSIPASGSRSDNEFVTPQKQVGTGIKQCNVSSIHKVKGMRTHGMLDGDDSQSKDRIPHADVSCSPQAMKLIASCRRSRHL